MEEVTYADLKFPEIPGQTTRSMGEPRRGGDQDQSVPPQAQNVSAVCSRPCRLPSLASLRSLCQDVEISDCLVGFLVQNGTWKSFRLERKNSSQTFPEFTRQELEDPVTAENNGNSYHLVFEDSNISDWVPDY
ncbi:uncharacterized protein LOC144676977 [Cetorhinus maximus]